MLTTADDVSIEAELDVPAGATVGVVLAHPHPLYGGSMRDGAPAVLFERLPAEGIGALRFNFRGVGASGGTHDRGGAERLDVQAAIDAMPDVPLVLCGWSFGADVSLCVDDARVVAWCPIAPPLAVVRVDDMRAPSDPRRKHLLVPEHDQYDPPDKASATTASWTNTTMTVLPGADHFLGGALGLVGDEVIALVRSLPT
jgi:hypothetical protein